MGYLWDLFKRGVMWLALYETGPADDCDYDDWEPQHGVSEDGRKLPVCYMPPAEHNAWGTMADYSMGMSSSDDDFSSAGAFDNSFSSGSGFE